MPERQLTVLYTKGCELAAGLPHPVSAARMKDSALRIARQADVVILCMGLSPRLEGEELKLNIPGFMGGDRTTLDLPKEQEDLIHAIAATGKPVILVLLNGSAISVNWEDQHLPAILEAWYPGQEGGTAIADVLFGDLQPRRPPAGDLLQLSQRSPQLWRLCDGRTHLSLLSKALSSIPSVTASAIRRFHYDSLQIEKAVAPGDSLLFPSVSPTPALSKATKWPKSISRPSMRMYPFPSGPSVAFDASISNPARPMTLHFAVAPDAFTVIDDKMQRVPLYGKYAISAGGGQPTKLQTGNTAPGPGQPRAGQPTRPATSNTITITATIPNKAS